MAQFQRPGERSAGAFGVSFSAGGGQGGNDRDLKDRRADPRSRSHAGAGTSGRPPQPPSQAQQPEHENSRLPVARVRKEILYLVEAHAVTIVVGETGSGKTTQVPRYLLEAGTRARKHAHGVLYGPSTNNMPLSA